MADDPLPAQADARHRIAALPPELGPVLRGTLPDVAREILVAIRDEVPTYRRPFEGAFGHAVRQGVEVALGEFVSLLEDPAHPAGETRVYEELGRGEVRSGRTLDALQSAYRTGARVAWRRFADTAHEHGADPATLIRLGDAIFAYIHRLAGLSVTGWAHEQSLRAGATQRLRDTLVRLVTGPRPPSPEDLAAAAAELGWRPPRAVAVLVAPGADGPGDLLRIDPGIVAAGADGGAVGIVPAPAVAERAADALAGRGAVLGPTVPWEDVARSWRRARTLAGLVAEGRVAAPADGTLRAAAHLPAIVVHGDGEAADELADAVLAPLDALAAGRRERHLETIRAWLDHRGHGPRMAEALHLHPQTVRYRVARVRETLAVDLDDPDARFALELALRRRGAR
ncbi:helix-turn-helix domain-containing protein [Patulibacter sp. SYSU D01012]|uniref:PucR family transcriptional regulator n=1 Tax=Patulibacter sp. SYSU D01012 TaxID=2817381 RepID=UPI001B30A22E|nr:helix-turn-helix domain-containing protein [Patulibacter sp. SYSU D01012]